MLADDDDAGADSDEYDEVAAAPPVPPLDKATAEAALLVQRRVRAQREAKQLGEAVRIKMRKRSRVIREATHMVLDAKRIIMGRKSKSGGPTKWELAPKESRWSSSNAGGKGQPRSPGDTTMKRGVCTRPRRAKKHNRH